MLELNSTLSRILKGKVRLYIGNVLSESKNNILPLEVLLAGLRIRLRLDD